MRVATSWPHALLIFPLASGALAGASADEVADELKAIETNKEFQINFVTTYYFR